MNVRNGYGNLRFRIQFFFVNGRNIDTSMFAPRKTVEMASDVCELFLIDLKCMDSDLHRFYTGVPNEIILENINLIASLNHPYYIRIPLIL